LPGIRFARYADDAVLHCKSKRQAEYVLDRIRERFLACKLEPNFRTALRNNELRQGHSGPATV